MFERADPSALATYVTALLYMKTGPLGLGGCTDMTTALDVARKMAS